MAGAEAKGDLICRMLTGGDLGGKGSAADGVAIRFANTV